ncbi:hypothetical protein MYSTI_02689 [Myxococcus stipitatus DSM 14675]|uniref:Uncharacterized protein n=1 Tax=Myxococcus stipitatus (strain DSM 14675 / JCM 12634 / Mx s8) TaxID=1278073 RepID=L7U885_MYXSD|nr:hypothetical protein [Myxococcus stipitatus]AGC44005.1 hypothetical protein MYSTI_02689 [Myxococcus stipitatus DSM 14675]
MNLVHEVYTLLAMRDLSVLFKTYETALSVLPKAQGAERLALHEAIVSALDGILTELGEHGLGNIALMDIDLATLDLEELRDSCAASWREVKKLREDGMDSGPLIRPYVADWMPPIGSRDWQSRMRLGVKHRSDPSWVPNLAERLKPE